MHEDRKRRIRDGHESSRDAISSGSDLLRVCGSLVPSPCLLCVLLRCGLRKRASCIIVFVIRHQSSAPTTMKMSFQAFCFSLYTSFKMKSAARLSKPPRRSSFSYQFCNGVLLAFSRDLSYRRGALTHTLFSAFISSRHRVC